MHVMHENMKTSCKHQDQNMSIMNKDLSHTLLTATIGELKACKVDSSDIGAMGDRRNIMEKAYNVAYMSDPAVLPP